MYRQTRTTLIDIEREGKLTSDRDRHRMSLQCTTLRRYYTIVRMLSLNHRRRYLATNHNLVICTCIKLFRMYKRLILLPFNHSSTDQSIYHPFVPPSINPFIVVNTHL